MISPVGTRGWSQECVLNGAVSQINHIQRFAPCRCFELQNHTNYLWRWEPDRWSNFFIPPAHLCAVTYMAEVSLISSGTKIVKRLRRRQDDLLIIERTIGLVHGPSTAFYRPFLKHCTPTNKAVGTIWRALSNLHCNQAMSSLVVSCY